MPANIETARCRGWWRTTETKRCIIGALIGAQLTAFTLNTGACATAGSSDGRRANSFVVLHIFNQTASIVEVRVKPGNKHIVTINSFTAMTKYVLHYLMPSSLRFTVQPKPDGDRWDSGRVDWVLAAGCARLVIESDLDQTRVVPCDEAGKMSERSGWGAR